MRASKAGFEIFQVGKYLGYCDLHSRIDNGATQTFLSRNDGKCFIFLTECRLTRPSILIEGTMEF